MVLLGNDLGVADREPGGAADEADPTVVEPLPDSTVGITTSTTPSVATLYHLNSWTTQSITTVGLPLNNHELLLLPNGDFMLIAYPILRGANLSCLMTDGSNATIVDCAVQEVDPQETSSGSGGQAIIPIRPKSRSSRWVPAPTRTRPTCTTATPSM
jgi:hypothetical protein